MISLGFLSLSEHQSVKDMGPKKERDECQPLIMILLQKRGPVSILALALRKIKLSWGV